MKRVFATVLVCLASLAAFGQVANTRWKSIAAPPMLSASSLSNFVSQPFYLTPGYGLGVEVTMATTNAATANVTFYLNLTKDGTNWLTKPPFSAAFPLNGSNTVRLWTNFPATAIDGAVACRIESATNAHTATVTISNVAVILPPF